MLNFLKRKTTSSKSEGSAAAAAAAAACKPAAVDPDAAVPYGRSGTSSDLDACASGAAALAGDFALPRRAGSQASLNRFLAAQQPGLAAHLRQLQADAAAAAAGEPPSLAQHQYAVRTPPDGVSPMRGARGGGHMPVPAPPGGEAPLARSTRERRRSVTLAELAGGSGSALGVSQAAMIMMPQRLRQELQQHGADGGGGGGGPGAHAAHGRSRRSVDGDSLAAALGAAGVGGRPSLPMDASLGGGGGGGGGRLERKPSIIREAVRQAVHGGCTDSRRESGTQQYPVQQPPAEAVEVVALRNHASAYSGHLQESSLAQLASALAGRGPESTPGSLRPAPLRTNSHLQLATAGGGGGGTLTTSQRRRSSLTGGSGGGPTTPGTPPLPPRSHSPMAAPSGGRASPGPGHGHGHGHGHSHGYGHGHAGPHPPVMPRGSSRRSDPGESFRIAALAAAAAGVGPGPGAGQGPGQGPAPSGGSSGLSPMEVVLRNVRQGLNRSWGTTDEPGGGGGGGGGGGAMYRRKPSKSRSALTLDPEALAAYRQAAAHQPGGGGGGGGGGHSPGVSVAGGVGGGQGGGAGGGAGGDLKLPSIAARRGAQAPVGLAVPGGGGSGGRAGGGGADAAAAAAEAMAAYQADAARLRAAALRKVDARITRAVMDRHLVAAEDDNDQPPDNGRNGGGGGGGEHDSDDGSAGSDDEDGDEGGGAYGTYSGSVGAPSPPGPAAAAAGGFRPRAASGPAPLTVGSGGTLALRSPAGQQRSPLAQPRSPLLPPPHPGGPLGSRPPSAQPSPVGGKLTAHTLGGGDAGGGTGRALTPSRVGAHHGQGGRHGGGQNAAQAPPREGGGGGGGGGGRAGGGGGGFLGGLSRAQAMLQATEDEVASELSVLRRNSSILGPRPPGDALLDAERWKV